MAAKKQVAENQYDERRETLVVETKTTWPDSSDLSDDERSRIAAALHQDPKETKKLAYVLCPSGLIRHITVTPEDIERVKAG